MRWAEVDMQKIVFNGHYLTYIDTAIAEYWRAIGLPYRRATLSATEPTSTCARPRRIPRFRARYDDVLTVCCRVASWGARA